MQQGSIIKAERKHGPAVWQFRWSETGPQGQRVYRKRVVGTIEDYADSEAVRVGLPEFDRQAQFRGSAGETNNHDGR